MAWDMQPKVLVCSPTVAKADLTYAVGDGTKNEDRRILDNLVDTNIGTTL